MSEVFNHTDSDGDQITVDLYPNAQINPFVISTHQKGGAMTLTGLSWDKARELRDALTRALGEEPETAEPESKDAGLSYMTVEAVDRRISVAFAMLAGRANALFHDGSEDNQAVGVAVRDLAEGVAEALRNLDYDAKENTK